MFHMAVDLARPRLSHSFPPAVAPSNTPSCRPAFVLGQVAGPNSTQPQVGSIQNERVQDGESWIPSVGRTGIGRPRRTIPRLFPPRAKTLSSLEKEEIAITNWTQVWVLWCKTMSRNMYVVPFVEWLLQLGEGKQADNNNWN